MVEITGCVEGNLTASEEDTSLRGIGLEYSIL